MRKLFLPAVAAALVCIACNDQRTADKKEEKPVTDPVTSHLDSSISPGENFFLFANNGWFRQHPIPSSESSNGIFRTIQDTINEAVKHICESAAADTRAAKGSNKQKIGDFYYSGMDTVTVEKAGITGLSEEFGKIASISNIPELLSVAAHLHTIGINPLYSFSVARDEKHSSQYTAGFSQVRSGLPERDYYFSNDAMIKNIRAEYLKHIKRMLQLEGVEEGSSQKQADAIMIVETALAKASRKMEDLRDPYKNYNKMTVAEFDKKSPGIGWSEQLNLLGLAKVDSVDVGQPEFFTALSANLKKISLNDWKSYLHWQVLNSFASYLDKKMVGENFNFYATIMEGVKEQKPRWKIVVSNTDNFLGELIGQVYVDEYLPKGTKEKLLEIGNNIRDVYAEHIKALDWMSDVTKQKALSKLNKITMKVGYPDKWKDMSSLEISRDNYMGNVISVYKWAYQFMINKYGKPVDRTEWDMYPQTYNAYYDPTSNEIVVPACNIIVPGFEGRMPDDAVLYGIIGGSTFGHEITHGFDDQGSQYDENGNLSDWWTKEDREKFVARTQKIVEQFNNYTVLDSLHLKGANTQGENIADLGGVIMGLEAFRRTPQGKSKELINGYTPEQRYFLAYAYAWMINQTDAALAKQVLSNEHAPAQYRVIGPLADVDAFYDAFHITEKDKMYRPEADRVKIW